MDFYRIFTHENGRYPKWQNKEVTIYGDPSNVPPPQPSAMISINYLHRWRGGEGSTKIISVNSFWVTFERLETEERISEPLRKITLSYDDENDRLKVIVDY